MNAVIDLKKNKLKNNFEKIEKDFQTQNKINLSHEKSIDDIKNKINDNKLIIQNMNNKNDNKIKNNLVRN